jgi:hypothetical protein
MTHDLLCFEFDKDDDDCFDHSLNSPFCYCELISMVRSDERMVIYAEHLIHDYERTGEAWEQGYKMGRDVERENCIEEISFFYASGDNTEYWRGFGAGLKKAIDLLHMGRDESS